MTTIYIVTSGDGSDGDGREVQAVFSTHEKADLFINGDSSGHWNIDKWELDDREDESVKTIWVCTLHLETGDIVSEHSYSRVCGKCYTKTTVGSLYAWGHSSISRDHACKLAAEKRQEYLREN